MGEDVKENASWKNVMDTFFAKFLADNECEIIRTRHSPRMIETKIKNDKLFIPHVMAVEKRRCRTDSGT